MTSASTHHRIAIIGTGFGGLGMAIRLKQAGIEDFVVCERDSDVGGTWWANTYPGCQCDIPSHLYSFSFAPNPEWTRTYPEQPELREYLRGCAERFGILDHIRFDCEVTEALWQQDACHWLLSTSQGSFTADFVIAAPGPLSEPSIPDLPGLDTFEGAIFHTARWDHEQSLAGSRVAMIGTGASAIQTAPQLQPEVEHLTIFQRTPPWVLPHRDRPISEGERALYRRLPPVQRLVRTCVYWARETLVTGLVYKPALMKVIERAARGHIAKQVSDPVLRLKVTPDYTIGCKRILPSNRWYPTLQQPNVELVEHGVSEIRSNAVVASDGSTHEVDAIVLATGFHVTDIALADRVRGVDGRSMAETWAGSPEGYLGTAIAGFPNLFFLIGPNTGLGHNSMVFMIEAQLSYLTEALTRITQHGVRRIEVRKPVQDAYNAEIQKRLQATVWNSGGCSSWYIDANGRNSTVWPDYTWRFWLRTRHFRPSDYELHTYKQPHITSPPQPRETVLSS
jgi:cation diffusion facilitator CzcD-associated flavoprotein CzcO